jgi:sodium/pantothenate symporter
MTIPIFLATSTATANSALVTFGIYIAFVFLIAALANRVQAKTTFVSEYFLGSKNIGMWAFALTYAATAASGGTFMGFPALIYTHGWSLAWWISGYMIVPLVCMGLFAKRINQVGRIARAITIPELLRNRFASPAVGNVATLLVLFFMFFYLLAQFKAGAEIMATLLEDVPVYRVAVTKIEAVTDGWFWIGQASGDYLLCLLVFAVSVIIYTAYGGFRAVVWTDVMQGLVMAVGVLILLVLTLSQVGGIAGATQKLAEMTPPEFGKANLTRAAGDPGGERILRRGDWIATDAGGMARLRESLVLPAGEGSPRPVEILILTTPADVEAVRSRAESGLVAAIAESTPYVRGAGEKGVYLTAPGPSKDSLQGFLPVFLAMSFFVFWNFSGAGQPSYMVRQMAFKDTVTLRRSIMLVSVYFTLIYFPLILIFTAARAIMPGMEIHPDRIMPEMAAHVTTVAGMPWLAGLLVAAPFAAVMSSVDSFLILVSSGVVRDIYQQSINPHATEKQVKTLSYTVTTVVGLAAVLAVLNPPAFLQNLIIFASGGLGAAFIMTIVLGLYWRRMTAAAAVASMLTGGATILVLYLIGYFVHGKFAEYNLLGLHPFIWSVIVTSIVIVVVSLRGQAPDEALVEKYFGDRVRKPL